MNVMPVSELIDRVVEIDEVEENRMSWGLFRDRRPHCYEKIQQ